MRSIWTLSALFSSSILILHLMNDKDRIMITGPQPIFRLSPLEETLRKRYRYRSNNSWGKKMRCLCHRYVLSRNIRRVRVQYFYIPLLCSWRHRNGIVWGTFEFFLSPHRNKTFARALSERTIYDLRKNILLKPPTR